MQIRLTIHEGKSASQERSFQLAPGSRVVIGRGEECAVSLWDEAASREHAALERQGDELAIIDLDSSNGTRVNGQKVQSAVLRGGEQCTIGATVIRIEIAGFQQKPTTVLRPSDEFEVQSTLSRDAVDLGSSFAPDTERRGRLNSLLRLVEEVQSLEAGEAILRALLEAAAKALPVGSSALVPVASRSRDPLWEEAIFGAQQDPAPPLSRSVIRRVVQDGDAIQVRDIHSDPRTRSRESLVGRSVGSVLAVPLAGRQRIHGVLYLECRDGAAFSEEDLAYAATLGQVAGMALQNAERLQTSRRVLHAQDPTPHREIITQSEDLKRTVELIGRFSASGGPVLITGETGTGKELLARHAHREGPFAGGPWIPVNCAAIPGTLLESELFGHEKGAFTGATGRKAGMFELAHQGTLFLDEIGDMPLELQSKLLRVLETGEFFRIGGRAPVSVKLLVVSATHRNLAAKVAEGEFREDLFFRLNRFQAEIPSLRERPVDIPLLADEFLREAARRLGLDGVAFSGAARAALQSYSWPGNVRELRNIVERGVVLAGGESVEPEHLSLSSQSLPPRRHEAAALGATAGGDATPAGALPDGALPDDAPPTLEEVEEQAIRQAMVHTGGKKGEAAQLLGIAWPTLRRKLKKYGIE